jgi:hypothetical protein
MTSLEIGAAPVTQNLTLPPKTPYLILSKIAASHFSCLTSPFVLRLFNFSCTAISIPFYSYSVFEAKEALILSWNLFQSLGTEGKIVGLTSRMS